MCARVNHTSLLSQAGTMRRPARAAAILRTLLVGVVTVANLVKASSHASSAVELEAEPSPCNALSLSPAPHLYACTYGLKYGEREAQAAQPASVINMVINHRNF